MDPNRKYFNAVVVSHYRGEIFKHTWETGKFSGSVVECIQFFGYLLVILFERRLSKLGKLIGEDNYHYVKLTQMVNSILEKLPSIDRNQYSQKQLPVAKNAQVCRHAIKIQQLTSSLGTTLATNPSFS
eukprot:gene19946-28235_t